MKIVSDSIVLQLKEIVTGFSGHLVHNSASLELRCGEVLGLVGGSGSGKSVLLRTMIGLHRPISGHIEILGRDLTGADEAAWRDIRRLWGVMFQSGALFSSLTVLENVAMPLKELTGLPSSVISDLAKIKIGLSGLAPEAAEKYPEELSGGMRKRAGLARALALDPQILFLDEPTAGLDPIGAADFDRLVLNLQGSLNLSMIMITHDLDSLFAICNRVAVLVDKKIVIGTIEEIMDNPHPWIQSYFRGPRARAAQKNQSSSLRPLSGGWR